MERDEKNDENQGGEHRSITLKGMFQNWFLDYASYVILERAVPHINDGLKPVQRRILHSMRELEDGRYNKVANLVGNTMKYHPHGDASIGDALVQLGQKELLIDCQGNWGNILTGDDAAAPRYIEARLSTFALEVVFNPKVTKWTASYDGRNKEPETLPVKFPLLLAQGVRGIAVGLTSDILPYNFVELIQASISILKKEPFEIFPDFPTGGLADFSKFKDGIRGGKARIRARIQTVDKRTLSITELPYGTTTKSLIDSILSANDKGKIKIKKIDDNTAGKVEILIHLPSDASLDQSMDALYAFTDCEISYSANACVIEGNKPRFLTASDILNVSTEHTLDLLKQELEIELGELQEKWQWISLERIFIENEVYEGMKKCTTDEEINTAIDVGLKPFVTNLIREVTIEDILRLRKIPIDRISKYNSDKANDILLSVEDDIKQVRHDLKYLVDYAVAYFERILAKYGKGRERKTELRNFENIEAVNVAVANEKLYVNYQEGFAGYKLKNDEYVCDCSDMDNIIIFRKDGTFIVTKIQEKGFVGKDILYVNVFRRNDERTIYNMIYQDGAFGNVMVKRFNVVGIVRDKEYALTRGTKGSKILYFTANPNGEAETINVLLKPKPRLKKTAFLFDFADVAVKGRASIGVILSRNAIRKITKQSTGVSTLSAREIWFDESIKRLNVDSRGLLLGKFEGDDRILSFMQTGVYKLSSYDLTTHFDDNLIRIEKYNAKRIVSVIYLEKDRARYFVKRFAIEEIEKPITFLDHEDTDIELIYVTTDSFPRILIDFEVNAQGKEIPSEEILLADFIGVKKHKAKGRRLSSLPIVKIDILDPLPEPHEDIEEEEIAQPTDTWLDDEESTPIGEGVQETLF